MDLASLLDQLDQRSLLALVLEVAADQRVEALLDQVSHATESLDHVRRLLVVDVDDHRKRQLRLEGVFGDKADLPKARVQLVHAGVGGDPFQDDVDRGDHDHLACVGVEGVLAGQECLVPDAAPALLAHLAVPESLARYVRARRSP